MKTKIATAQGCRRIIKIEVLRDELQEEFDRVYTQIGRTARIAGFRPGHAPRDLLEVHYGGRAEEEVIKRAIPEYYLKAVKEKKLIPVSTPEIENVQFGNHILSFSAKLDVKPEVKFKGSYKKLKITKKKIKIEQNQIEQALENLRQSKSQGKDKPELNQAFAKELGFQTLDELKQAVAKNLEADAEGQGNADMERQALDHLLKVASLDVPELLVNSQMQDLARQLKLNYQLRGEKEEELKNKENQLQTEARKEAVRRVKLSFILAEIAQLENIQASQEDLENRIAAIAQRSGKTNEEVKQYLQRQNLIPGLEAELKERKTVEFLLKQAKIEEGKGG